MNDETTIGAAIGAARNARNAGDQAGADAILTLVVNALRDMDEDRAADALVNEIGN